MSMSAEHAAELKNELAVVCCRTEEGTIISADNLEDPAIFPDMVDAGLMAIPADCLKIGEVLGAKLLKTIDSLTPLTPDLLEGAAKAEAEVKEEEPAAAEVAEVESEVEAEPEMDAVVVCEGGILRIKIEEGKGIDIEFPL
ncbi:MAG: PrdA domain protein [Firmicutes bacterium]|nr:PrdA domain protein [Bacillota bacterium]